MKEILSKFNPEKRELEYIFYILKAFENIIKGPCLEVSEREGVQQRPRPGPEGSERETSGGHGVLESSTAAGFQVLC